MTHITPPQSDLIARAATSAVAVNDAVTAAIATYRAAERSLPPGAEVPNNLLAADDLLAGALGLLAARHRLTVDDALDLILSR